MIIKRISAILFGLFCVLFVSAQQNKVDQLIETLVEEIAEQNDEELDYNQLTEYYFYLLENPLNLNHTNIEALESLKLLTPFQVNGIINYIKKNGSILTIYELQLIEGFNYNTIQKILPFVTFSNDTYINRWKLSNALKYGKQEIYSRISSNIEKQTGYYVYSESQNEQSSSYPGNRLKLYNRYKFNYRNILQWGITAEKDPGESILVNDKTKGFDFYSVHLQINNIGLLKTLIIGDYQVQFGQGLVIWSNIGRGKSSYALDVRKHAKGINRSTSANENLFMRGAAICMQMKNLEFSAFASIKPIDANVIKNDTTNTAIYFTSFQNSGIHATPSQLKNEKSLNETLAGGNLSWKSNYFKVGLTGIHYKYSLPLITNDRPENQFKFSGSENSNVSTDIEFRLKNMHVFSEAALSQNGGKSILAGTLLQLSSQFNTSLLYRNYEKNYQANYSNAFTEGSRTQNEEGFYIGFQMLPIKKWKLSGYYDFFKFPWLTQQSSAPSQGNDYLLQADFVANQIINMYIRYKHEIKGKSYNTGELINKQGELSKQSIRYQVNYAPLLNWQFRNRIEMSIYNSPEQKKESGFLLYQDVIYRPIELPFALTFRYALFDTKSYNSRIYTYENDVLYAFSIPAFYDKGTRTFLLLQYNLNKKINIWLRYGQTWYVNKTEIGSGLNKINGNTKSEVKVQLRYKF